MTSAHLADSLGRKIGALHKSVAQGVQAALVKGLARPAHVTLPAAHAQAHTSNKPSDGREKRLEDAMWEAEAKLFKMVNQNDTPEHLAAVPPSGQDWRDHAKQQLDKAEAKLVSGPPRVQPAESPKEELSRAISALKSMGQMIPQAQVDKAFQTAKKLENALFHTAPSPP